MWVIKQYGGGLFFTFLILGVWKTQHPSPLAFHTSHLLRYTSKHIIGIVLTTTSALYCTWPCEMITLSHEVFIFSFLVFHFFNHILKLIYHKVCSYVIKAILSALPLQLSCVVHCLYKVVFELIKIYKYLSAKINKYNNLIAKWIHR